MASEINNYISDMFVEMASRISKLESKVAKLEADNYAMNKHAMTVNEAREYLGGVSAPTIYSLISSKQINSFHVGRRRMILTSELNKFIEDNSKELSKSKK